MKLGTRGNLFYLDEQSLNLSPHQINAPDQKFSDKRCASKHKAVRFCEKKNTYHDAASSSILKSESLKRRVWYNFEEMDQFMTDFCNVTIHLEKENRCHARVWLQTLHLAYQSSLEVNRSAHCSTLSKAGRERLHSMYLQEPELIGIEALLLPKLRADASLRKKNLLHAIRHVSRSRMMEQPAKDYHIRVLSEKISQPSRQFAKEIAFAQFGYIRSVPKRIVLV
ncbi:hypothetical protein ACA910_022242 [Epithemia clementina (nom. ined.)]